MPCDSPICILALEDGTVFRGKAFGGRGTQTGEVVFNTSLTGYEEILTDPSYCGQIVTMTCPQIGNYGITLSDQESARPHVAGLVIKELSGRYSNHSATMSLGEYLHRHGVIGLEGVDTRALTRRVRLGGALRAVMTTEISDPVACVELARASPPMEGADLVSVVAPKRDYEWTEGLDGDANENGSRCTTPRRVVVIDCGAKRNILRHLTHRVGPIRVVPPTSSAGDILDLRPQGVMVSNGPGDPAAVKATIETLRQLVGRVPIFGICLGHQLLALALGAQRFKLKFGHHGANHPVRNLAGGRVEITSQNHGFAIDMKSLEARGAVITHVNLNDQTVEGFSHPDKALMAVQYHPEANPGPHDATYLFDCFTTMIDTGSPPTVSEMAAAQAVSVNRHLEMEIGVRGSSPL